MRAFLAYVHPVVQVLVLVMAFATLRLGLALKQHRLGQRTLLQWQGVYERHTQLGVCVLLCLAGGYGLGLLSMPLLRDQAPFRSAHFFFGTLALLLFLGAGYTGWLLKRGTARAADVRDIHGFLVYLALFVALAVAVMGFILLP
ncbi:MAG: DUF4079 family protein [Candidatus Tectimicrobiota bacterium]